MTNYGNSTDANSAEICRALRGAGCSVLQIKAATGEAGCPDLLVARYNPSCMTNHMYLLEIKTAKGKVSPAQAKFALSWPTHVYVVRSLEEALEAVGLVPLARP